MKELKTLSDLKYFAFRFEELKKLSRKLHKIQENQCNGYSDFKGDWDSKREQADLKREKKLYARAEEIAKEFNLKAYLQGDCRGCALYLIEESEFIKGSNCNYTNGIAVY